MFGFVVAVWAVRAWVVRDELRFPRRSLALLGGILLLTIASYGLLHPMWVADAEAWTSSKSTPSILLLVHNGGRVAVEVDRVSGEPLASVRTGFPGREGRGSAAYLPSGSTRAFVLRMRGGGCGLGQFHVRVRYRVFGLTLSEPLGVAPFGVTGC